MNALPEHLALDFLRKLVSYRSLAGNSNSEPELHKLLVYLVNHLRQLGFQVRQIGNQAPLIMAYLDVKAKSTLGFYCHYDVQPADQVDKWQTDPFRLTVANGKIYGRGAADDKGHLAQLLTVISQRATGQRLNHNLLLLVEGEEEMGSPHFEEYLAQIKPFLQKVTVFYVLDAGAKDKNTPMFLYGLRGIIDYKLTVRSAQNDLHSGTAGNLVANPAHILCQYLAGLKNKANKVNLPGFYRNVIPLNNPEKNLLKKEAYGKTNLSKRLGVKQLFLPKGAEYYLASRVLPSFDINGINSGYTGESFKTIIPASAVANFSFRLVPNQIPDKAHFLLQQYTRRFFARLPVKYNLVLVSASHPFRADLNDPLVKRTIDIFAKHFTNGMVFSRSGASIPAAGVLSRLTGKPVLVTGFILPDCHLHAPNENYDLLMFNKGLRVLRDLITQ